MAPGSQPWPCGQEHPIDRARCDHAHWRPVARSANGCTRASAAGPKRRRLRVRLSRSCPGGRAVSESRRPLQAMLLLACCIRIIAMPRSVGEGRVCVQGPGGSGSETRPSPQRGESGTGVVCASPSEQDLQLPPIAALAFSRDVHVYDIQTHQVQIISGQRPWDSQHIVVDVPLKVAYRRHKEIWAYDQNFRPLGPNPRPLLSNCVTTFKLRGLPRIANHLSS